MYTTHSLDILSLSFTAGTDYSGGNVTGAIVAGSTRVGVVIMITDDDIEEVNEEIFSISLILDHPPAGVILRGSQGTVKIVDNDSKCSTIPIMYT